MYLKYQNKVPSLIRTPIIKLNLVSKMKKSLISKEKKLQSLDFAKTVSNKKGATHNISKEV